MPGPKPLLVLFAALAAVGVMLRLALPLAEDPATAVADAAMTPAPTATAIEPAVQTAIARATQGVSGEVVPGFGGLFLDPDDNSVVYVYLLDPSQQAVAEYAARTLLGHREIREVRALQGRYGIEQLSRWYHRMRDVVSSVDGLTMTDLDAGNNRIRLAFVPRPNVREKVEAGLTSLGIPHDAVHIEVGCPTGEPFALPTKPDTPALKALDLRLEALPPELPEGQPVNFELVVKNISAEPVSLEHGLGSRFVVTGPDGGIVWDSLCGRIILLPAMQLTLAPGEEFTHQQEPTLAGTWPQWDNRGLPVAPGSYRVFGLFDTLPDLVSPPYDLLIAATP